MALTFSTTTHAGPQFFDESAVLRPQTGSLSRKPCALAGEADVLARESPANNVNCPDIEGSQVTHILEDGHAGPVLAEDGSTVGVDLAEGDGSHSGSFESE